ncbi:hypothetical protein OG453_25305 [Streptomyces sp. NBC_01381]|uniref:hypothetical protein n=1 Tax=Streptomyces sp. NBC_01381 TaxID=2903845 RepID=UPI002253104F|nr:hypothetical protein [Streptomyces sp. NBC_01381]MCX4669966.1 hypothetical protein [Streptomyces sp. NBC_01381]
MDQNQIDDIGHRIGSAAAQFAPSHKPTPLQKADAAAVLHAMVQATEIYGVKFADFDAVADFPRMAIQLVQSRDAQS